MSTVFRELAALAVLAVVFVLVMFGVWLARSGALDVLAAQLRARRQRKHELPYTAGEMDVFRCRVQALVAQSRRAKAAKS